MLTDDDLHALRQARHPDPFAVLGLHADAQGALWVRALLPGAQSVQVVDTASGRRLATLACRHDDGLLEGAVPRRRRRFDYRLRVRWWHGGEGDLDDPYRHGPLLDEAQLRAFHDGTHVRPFVFLGAHPVVLGKGVYASAGTRFAVWAPNASRVSVVGDFNGWDGRRHPMRRRGGSGVWELFVPQAAPGDHYKFEIRTRDGTVLPLKCDPFARASQVRPQDASVVAPPLGPARALPGARAAANHRRAPISIYEVHAGSWRRGEDGRFLEWEELAATLPAYAAGLGFTHVELLPVSEHPFDGSWGYQTLGMYAPTARFGPAEGLRRFVDACHAHGLGVIVDWVPAHFPTDAHGLARFDGTALYEHADPREGFHQDWQTLIYNFGRHEVRSFLVGSALYWVERMGVDGLRVDAVASMLYRDYSRPADQWVPNVHGGRENLEAISLLQRVNEVLGTECPGAFTVAEESTSYPGVSAPTWAGGLGFHFKWNMGWMNDTLRYMQEDPVHRRWHHEGMTFGLLYAFSENFVLPLSHDEVVHGKRSLLGRMPGDDWQRFANLRAYLGFMWAHPGKKLLFMGQEFAQPWEWNHDAELPWGLLRHAPHAGMQRLVGDLNRLMRDQAALHRADGDAAGFAWLDADDRDHSVLAWVRRAGPASGEVHAHELPHATGASPLVVVCNFTPVPRHGWRLGVPQDTPGCGAWREVLNTDATDYGGSGMGNAGQALATTVGPWQGQPAWLTLTLPPLATLILAPCG